MNQPDAGDTEVFWRELLKSADPQAGLVELVLKRLAMTDETFARIARLAAIPRRLDRGIVGALRGGGPDPEGDGEILARLAQLDFAESGPARPLAYHDSVRGVLLAQLRSDPALRPLFEEANGRLVGHAIDELYAAYERYQDLRRVRPILADANPQRLRRLSEAAESEVVTPALDALYHRILVSGSAGWQLFTELFSWQEERQLFASCRALRLAAEDNMERFAPDSLQEQRAWLRYYDGRVAWQQRDLDTAEAAYQAALGDDRATPELRAWSLAALAEVYSETYKLAEALDKARESLAVRSQAGARTEAAAFSVGFLQRRLGLTREARETFGSLAESAATDESTHEWWFIAQGHISLIYLDLGLRREALRLCLALLDFAYGRPKAIRLDLVNNVTSPLAFALSEYHLPAALTALRESVEIFHQYSGDQAAPLLPEIAFTNQLGMMRYSAKLLDDLGPDVPEPSRAEFLETSARYLERNGQFEEALARWQEMRQLTGAYGPTPEQEILAIINCAELQARLGHFQAAAEDCIRASAEAIRLGHEPMRGIIGVVRAVLLTNMGQFEDADHLLTEAEPLVAEAPIYGVDLHTAAARLAYRQGRLDEALRRFSQAISIADSTAKHDRVALLYGELAQVAADKSDWSLVAEAGTRLRSSAQTLADRANQEFDPVRREADRIYLSGIRALHGAVDESALSGEVRDPGRVAAEYLAECVRRYPEHPLYVIALAYAHVRNSDWGNAAAGFEQALRQHADFLPDTAIEDRLFDCLVRHGDDLTEADDAAQALISYRQAAQHADAWPDRLADIRLRIGDSLVRLRRVEDADEFYRLVASSADRSLRGAALSRQGVLHVIAGNPESAHDSWLQALSAYNQEDPVAAYWRVVRQCSRLGSSVSANPAVIRQLRELRDNPSAGEPMIEFRASLQASVPSNWVTKEQITLLAPDGEANVIASVEPLSASMRTEEYAQRQGELLRNEFPGFEELDFREVRLLDGQSCLQRGFSWSPPDQDRVTQVQLYYADAGRGYTATATASSARFAELELELGEILASLVLGRGAPA